MRSKRTFLDNTTYISAVVVALVDNGFGVRIVTTNGGPVPLVTPTICVFRSDYYDHHSDTAISFATIAFDADNAVVTLIQRKSMSVTFQVSNPEFIDLLLDYLYECDYIFRPKGFLRNLN